MKRYISLLIAILILLLSFTGCSIKKSKKTALVISGTEVDEEVYAYFLDIVKQRPNDYGLEKSFKESQARDEAIKLCVRYVAFNTSFAQRELKLTNTQKLEIADNVNSYWIRSENHCKAIGVSRQTINKIYTSKAYENVIFKAIYDKGTGDAEAEAQIQKYFYSNYTAFSNICAYFTNAQGENISGEAKQQLIETFRNIAASSGETAKEFAVACSDNGYAASDVVILKKDSDGYPAGFFMKVYVMAPDTVKVYDYDDCVFAVRKENLKELGDNIYNEYRDVCIEDMNADNWKNTMDNYIKGFTVDEIKV